ncbi:hypothetical protein Pfo_027792 [Paulownia fortunei]|nr:hypothetical protein Pfo_027792 [Paulownia fortunei]
MEAQLQRSHGHHHYEEDPQHAGLHSVIEGEGEGEGEHHHHGEKKSVLKKVKDKAKKIKDTIKKHGHGHDNEHEHEGGHLREDNYQEGYEEDEEDNDDEEIVNDAKVHGAPMYESTVIRSIDLPRETDINIEKPTDTREHRYAHNVRDEGISRPFAPGQRAPELGRPPAMEASPSENKNTLPTSPHAIDREKPNVEGPKIKIEPPVGLEEDPHSPKNRSEEIPPSNYQSKVCDPTGAGGKEAEVAPLVRQFDNLNVHEASVSKPESEQRSYTGSNDQFCPQPTPTKDQFNPESNPVGTQENPKLDPKSQDPASSVDTSQNTIAGKISSATSAVANKAVFAKNLVVSKLGYGGGHQEDQDSSKKPVSESATEYAHKVAEKLAGAGSAVTSKVHGSGGAEHQGGDVAAAEGANNGLSMKEYLAEKFRPGAEDKALSEVITDALYKKKEAMRRKGEQEEPVGKVRESEEVAARLGTGAENKREGEDALAAGAESSGKGVVDRLKDAVSLWLGQSSGMQTAQDSVSKSYVSDVGSAGSGVGQGQGEEVSDQRENQATD